MPTLDPEVRKVLQRGVVIPAHPLALDANRKLDKRRQAALTRYYIAAGAGGIAVGVHTTQFAIRDPAIGLYRPVLALAANEMDRAELTRDTPLVRIGGLCGNTQQAVSEAKLLDALGYHAGLLSLAAFPGAGEDALIAHCAAVAEVIPVIGFYLQTAVGGRHLSYNFWRRFAQLENLVAVKIAPFNRYQTLDVMRAIAESGREDIALYTGNDDSIVPDLLTPYRFQVANWQMERQMVGGLLGHWAVWTRTAVDYFEACRRVRENKTPVSPELLRMHGEITDANAAFFDAANGFKGCIAGLHEVLRRQGLFEGIWCLDPAESLSPGQAGEIDRVYKTYPHLNDDAFVAAHRETWLAD